MAISVATLIDQAQALADKRNDASITAADWTTYVNWAVKALYRTIAALDPAFYFAQADFTLTATAGGSSKDLSTVTWSTPNLPFMALHGLDKDADTANRRTIRRRNFRERNISPVSWWAPAIFDDNRAYDLRGRTLVVTPYESAAGSYRAYARLGPYLFANSTDPTALDWQLEPYDEFLVIMTARKGLGIEETDTGLQSERLTELRTEITAEHTRDDGEASTIADVEQCDGWDGDR